jgi:hypothetical protein
MYIFSDPDWQYVLVAVLLEALVLVGAILARSEGWLTPLSHEKQAEYRPITRFFTFVEHGGVWALVALNIPLAIAFARASPRWNIGVFLAVQLVMLVASVCMMKGWAEGDNAPQKRVLSAFSRDGLLTATGMLLAISMAEAYTITVMYFLTPGLKDGPFPLIFAIVLSVYLPFGLLQPPFHVWGKIHKDAWRQFFGGLAVVWELYVWQALQM